MSIFSESPRFPDYLAAWLVGGPSFNTTIVQTYGGDEYRNAPWAYPLGQWTLSEALGDVRETSSHAAGVLMKFLYVMQGQLGGFRVQIPNDYTDSQAGGTGVLGPTGLATAATLSYQMFKKYTLGSLTFYRKILKPVGTSLAFFDNGSPATPTIDTTTGIVTFASQPTVGHTLTWTGQFDVPVRFDGDTPQLGLESTGSFYDWANLKLKELRNP